MSSLANVSIVGNLTRNPEKVEFQNGRKKTTLTVAVNNYSRDAKDKEKTVKTADFYRVETWDKLAELTALYLVKGNQVAVSGKLSMDKWLGNDGKERMTPTVRANQVALPPRAAKPPEESAASSSPWTVVSKSTAEN
jgi:single-strand DNA-binding protein